MKPKKHTSIRLSEKALRNIRIVHQCMDRDGIRHTGKQSDFIEFALDRQAAQFRADIASRRMTEIIK